MVRARTFVVLMVFMSVAMAELSRQDVSAESSRVGDESWEESSEDTLPASVQVSTFLPEDVISGLEDKVQTLSLAFGSNSSSAEGENSSSANADSQEVSKSPMYGIRDIVIVVCGCFAVIGFFISFAVVTFRHDRRAKARRYKNKSEKNDKTASSREKCLGKVFQKQPKRIAPPKSSQSPRYAQFEVPFVMSSEEGQEPDKEALAKRDTLSQLLAPVHYPNASTMHDQLVGLECSSEQPLYPARDEHWNRSANPEESEPVSSPRRKVQKPLSNEMGEPVQHDDSVIVSFNSDDAEYEL